MLAPEFLPVWGGVGTYIVELVRHLPKDIENSCYDTRTFWLRIRMGNFLRQIMICQDISEAMFTFIISVRRVKRFSITQGFNMPV